jgi:2-oxoglutarate ferredoxin oxidoreductase subunit beta
MERKRPEAIYAKSMNCPGCGHGIFDRILAEVLAELQCLDKAICAIDIGCGTNTMDYLHCDYICGPHGRSSAVAIGIKKVRPHSLVFTKQGDGSAYSIGLAETLSVALRNENITVFVVQNGVYGMTGGQMALTTIDGQVTTSTPLGRDAKKTGAPFDVVKVMGQLDIAYLARGSLSTVAKIKKTKKYIRKALEKQLSKSGFSLVEVLSPCPTNWKLTPVAAIERISKQVEQVYSLGEFIDQGDK